MPATGRRRCSVALQDAQPGHLHAVREVPQGPQDDQPAAAASVSFSVLLGRITASVLATSGM